MDDIRLRVLNMLKARGMTLAAAESCTGGLIASAFVDMSGASEVFKAGLVTYMEEMKVRLLGVKSETLINHTAVSPQTAEEMCVNVSKLCGADIGVSSTGYAGPDGGTDTEPVGTVYIGIYIFGSAHIRRLSLNGDRNEVRNKAVEEVFNFLYELLTK